MSDLGQALWVTEEHAAGLLDLGADSFPGVPRLRVWLEASLGHL